MFTFDRLGDVVSAIGSPTFAGEYYRLFQEALGIEVCTVFAFRGGTSPVPLFVETDSQDRRTQAWDLAWEYTRGAFKHDPIIRSNLGRKANQVGPAVYQLCADQVNDAGYRQHFYEEPALRQKIGVLGHIDGTVYYSNFYHGFKWPVCEELDELRLLRELAGLAVKVIHRHDVAVGHMLGELRTSASTTEWHRNALLHLYGAFLEGAPTVSPREAEVCAHIVLGYSTEAIGLNLGISVNTVATHRKRAYQKLGVCSQNELFERYFSRLNNL